MARRMRELSSCISFSLPLALESRPVNPGCDCGVGIDGRELRNTTQKNTLLYGYIPSFL